MTKRETVPPLRAGRPGNPLFDTTQPASAPLTAAHMKTSAYLRPDQITALDERRAAHRAAGRRTVSASDLIRTALDLAAQHPDEWDELVEEQAR